MTKWIRPITGLATVAAILMVIALAAVLFQGKFTSTVAVTVITQRAGLVMNPDAKVTLLGVPVGAVASIEMAPGGEAVMRLDMEPGRLRQIPKNVQVVIASPTVFGAKSVNLVPPVDPSPERLSVGQVLRANQVTVEINTVFEELTSVLLTIQPGELDATLTAVSEALDGRGAQFGEAMSELNHFLGQLDPVLPDLAHDLAVAPEVLDTYAESAAGLVKIADDATAISTTIVEMQDDLDRMLVSATGLADVGNDVLSTNRQSLADLLHILVPTTDLTNRYNEALTCGLQGLNEMAKIAPPDRPGVITSTGIMLGQERYRYPANLPKVAAKGGPQCTYLPRPPMNARVPFVVADVGANPAQYGNKGLLLNSDALKQMLFGPLDGPPRNTAQVGQPG